MTKQQKPWLLQTWDQHYLSRTYSLELTTDAAFFNNIVWVINFSVNNSLLDLFFCAMQELAWYTFSQTTFTGSWNTFVEYIRAFCTFLFYFFSVFNLSCYNLFLKQQQECNIVLTQRILFCHNSIQYMTLKYISYNHSQLYFHKYGR